MLVLGIESSCDETAAAVVNDRREILGEVVLSQLDEHRPFGGVVPEIAARSHLAHMDKLVAEAMRRAGVGFADLDAVAATGGPGLIGGVIVGVMTGKAIALAAGKPFLAVNHLEGHALTPRLTHDIAFPYLLLLASGGHCQLLAVEGVGRYTRLGTTIDDAAGEAFDKVAKMAGLGYPGGPAVEAAAQGGDPARFTLPRPMKGKPGCDFSFSGLKNAARLLIESLPQPLSAADQADVARAFQDAVADAMADRVRRGVREMKSRWPQTQHLVVAGGVAANTALRQVLVRIGNETGLEFLAPPLKLCTDNAAMIAWAGLERLRLGQSDDLTFAPRPRWPLDPTARKGAKA
ncbi:tRNA (adenosine(37)-N6)-threonylcarbamoyltransferase complex transferase subunit TsaD [Paramagnetospirillum magneticum]|uniref:tRNA N6-adenosine threonylcarbamoyltransferase n=1 Tax=Paramagnetospirillum magneticum (strain ATCC 700264 / AMB-1) TaxID=342108 RepID=TSAD_PARM1|nr:tRNA (adenosine(37)-N6)-threonylcarbamoyltransferase complex transferase subunit TsaD [Paramagnetospirillum magneticum]Q2VYV2.1 RecName: Full=tRNA N6-adenosine threonylcarbamoyltransferase; AltName: Full=N6-L-threonylcarbamoyladenine synthase; Short=t(6)A synthase; AltName: Full=t(6)A37 threonylcarbamoyladenosine biosynthesis protein TsaD; AltName: Full=tRNA threonylcarbamoyladenosine biosynthesis protein TsaD [Paramagnetospirillum magneticum AMB-1]BAE53223.1 Metal-dependent protease with poss